MYVLSHLADTFMESNLKLRDKTVDLTLRTFENVCAPYIELK